jgi:hypothetical protein
LADAGIRKVAAAQGLGALWSRLSACLAMLSCGTLLAH